jgi:Domain of unknown function (DUF397)
MDLTKAVFRKSSYSGSNGGNCVEVAVNVPGVVAIRDSKNPDGPALVLDPVPFEGFTACIRAGEFDL